MNLKKPLSILTLSTALQGQGYMQNSPPLPRTEEGNWYQNCTLWVVEVLDSLGQRLRSVSEMSETSSTVAQGFTSAGSGHQNWLSNIRRAWDATVFHSTRAGRKISLCPNLRHHLWHCWEELLQPASRFFCCKHFSLLLLHLRRNVNSKEVTDIRREGKSLDIRHLLGLRHQMKRCGQHTIQGHEALQHISVLNPEERRQKGMKSSSKALCSQNNYLQPKRRS